MAKRIPTTIAQAMSCASKVRQGKACTMAELKATVQLLQSALSSSRAATRAAKDAASDARAMVDRLLSRVG
jgi:hypothetical protein